MANMAYVKDVGYCVKGVVGVPPQTNGGSTATANGPSHDVQDYGSAVGHFMIGSTSGGGPDITVRIEHSDDGSSSWAELPDVNGSTGVYTKSVTASTSSNTNVEIDAQLTHAKRYVRAVLVITSLNSATSIPFGASLVLGGVTEAEVPV